MAKNLTYEFIKEQFGEKGWVLESTKYVNNHTKLSCVCPNGHECSVLWRNWQSRKKCPVCSGKAKKTVEFIKNSFDENGYILLTTEYINAYQKLDYICPEGHRHFITWNSWQQEHRCPYCARNGKPTIEFIKSEFAKEGYRLLTTKYKNAFQKLDYICPKGHRHSIRWAEWKYNGNRCPYCTGIISKGETQVRNFIESLGIKVSPNDRNQIFNPDTGNGFELDIFMPTLNKAVEYNGEYWHKNRKKDLLKQRLCGLRNIDLLTIWESRWKTEKNICKDKIKEFIFK